MIDLDLEYYFNCSVFLWIWEMWEWGIMVRIELEMVGVYEL